MNAVEFYGADKYAVFRAEESMHFFTTAFGKCQQRFSAFCSREIAADFKCGTSMLDGEVWLKMTAMLDDWKRHSCPCEILVNGNVVFRGALFLENVASGWPSVYFSVPDGILRSDSSNSLVLKNLSDGGRLIILNKAALISFPSPAPFSRKPRRFSREASSTPLGCVPFFTGMDSDDHRHDSSVEMERILNYFVNTDMGNLVCFRPYEGRNFAPGELASKERWLSWLDTCRDSGVAVIYHNTTPPVSLGEAKLICGELFKGLALHEPYLQFQPQLYGTYKEPEILNAKNMLDKKDAYLRYIRKIEKPAREAGVETFVGDPSLLLVYLRDSEVDNILVEPATNSGLLLGAARGTGKKFGAHISVDWYLGGPHDASKTLRFKLLLHLTYAYGGTYAYTENSLFKTSAHERYDWEDSFCVGNRDVLREFYAFVKEHPRVGSPKKKLAAVYGNLESMFWLPDDRLPELIDTDNWDDYVWGKWRDTSYRMAWKAVNAWLPPFICEPMERDETFTKLFSGTPFGPVDVVLPDGEIDEYAAIAFFGWNTMNDKIFENLVSYVKNGGSFVYSRLSFRRAGCSRGGCALFPRR